MGKSYSSTQTSELRKVDFEARIDRAERLGHRFTDLIPASEACAVAIESPAMHRSGVPGLQRVITVAKKQYWGLYHPTRPTMGLDNDEAVAEVWGMVKPFIALNGKFAASDLDWMRDKLHEWIMTPAKVNAVEARIGRWSQKRVYNDMGELAIGLIGEMRQKTRVVAEHDLALRKVNDKEINSNMASLMQKLYSHIVDVWSIPPETINTVKTDWKWWTPWTSTLLAELKNPTPGYKLNYAFFRNACYPTERKSGVKAGNMTGHESSLTDPVSRITTKPTFRHGEYNVAEAHEWVKRARERSIPLMAGPSNTMTRLYRTAEKINATTDEINALAWSGFIFHNLHFFSTRSLSHTLHEMLDVGVEFGVDYNPDNYDEIVGFQEELSGKLHGD